MASASMVRKPSRAEKVKAREANRAEKARAVVAELGAQIDWKEAAYRWSELMYGPDQEVTPPILVDAYRYIGEALKEV